MSGYKVRRALGVIIRQIEPGVNDADIAHSCIAAVTRFHGGSGADAEIKMQMCVAGVPRIAHISNYLPFCDCSSLRNRN